MMRTSYDVGRIGEEAFRDLMNRYGVPTQRKSVWLRDGKAVQSPGPDYWTGFAPTPVEVKTVSWKGHPMQQAVQMRHFQKSGSVLHSPSAQVRALLEHDGWVYYYIRGLTPYWNPRAKHVELFLPFRVLWDRMAHQSFHAIRAREILTPEWAEFLAKRAQDKKTREELLKAECTGEMFGYVLTPWTEHKLVAMFVADDLRNGGGETIRNVLQLAAQHCATPVQHVATYCATLLQQSATSQQCCATSLQQGETS